MIGAEVGEARGDSEEERCSWKAGSVVSCGSSVPAEDGEEGSISRGGSDGTVTEVRGRLRSDMIGDAVLEKGTLGR